MKQGFRLGPYEILGTLGAGGMGEVYRARDTRLDRVVALKVLPGHLSGNEELRQRFDREARSRCIARLVPTKTNELVYEYQLVVRGRKASPGLP